MSRALNRRHPATPLPAADTFIFSARVPVREHQSLIERSYSEQDPDSPALPGAVSLAILILASVASWSAVIALIRAIAS